MNLKRILLISAIAYAASQAAAYKPLDTHIHTPWASEVTPDNVWDVYPRPIMERSDWQNLNGQWNYAITAADSGIPGQYEGEIMVPFAVESDLSGVGRRVDSRQALWYNRTFAVPAAWKGRPQTSKTR